MGFPFRKKKTSPAIQKRKDIPFYHKHPISVPPTTRRRIKWLKRGRQ